jgi:DNA-binding SARP family transcriptional activator
MRQRQAHVEAVNQQHKLFEHANRAARAGRYIEAKRLLTQVWAGAADNDELAGAAAWTIGWVLVQEHAFAQAVKWFARANLGTGSVAHTWPFVQQALSNHFMTVEQPKDPPSIDPTLPKLRITSLGSFQVVRGGEALPTCHARKAIAVLRYLLTQPHFSAHKDQIAEQFWPNSGAQEAAHSLHVAIAALRRYLDPPHASYLLFAAGCYTIVPDAGLSCDAILFQQQIEAANVFWHADERTAAALALAGAITIYTGDYIVMDRDGAWALSERERLLVQYLTALDRLGRIHLHAGRYADAAECFRLLLERDSYREDACANLMHCYHGLGRRHDALHAFEQCSSLLRTDLGLEPSEPLTAVWHEVSAGPISR